jgi:hypothetical protein
MDKNSNFIGQYFRQYIRQTGFDRKILAKKLNWNYANNDRMICAYFTKRDYLWEQYEVEQWCRALCISKKNKIFGKLMEKAGKKAYDYNE